MTAISDPYEVLLQDLRDESDEISHLISKYRLEALNRSTPAKGWNVADSINHLTYFDRALALAIEDPAGFEVAKKQLLEGGIDLSTDQMRLLSKEIVVSSFSEARTSLLSLLSNTPAKQRVPWYGPEMSAMSAASARLMETFAHGIDIYDALGEEKTFTDRISHICFLGFATIAFSFTIHGLAVPTEPFYLELELPSGALYSKGNPESPNSIRGSARDYVLLVTQRRSRGGLDLETTGEMASVYLEVAQAFAGSPTKVDPERAKIG